MASAGAGVAVAACLLALNACGGGDSSPNSSDSPPSSDSPTSSESRSTSTDATGPSSSGTTSSTGAGKPEPAELTGYGATKSAWLSAHEQAPGYTKGVAFLPMVQRGNESYPKYASVQLDTPVVAYSINLPAGTSLDEAKLTVLDEFPPGARFDILDQDQTTCLIASIKSPPAQRALQAGGWGNSVPIAAFGTSTATQNQLDPANVTDVTLVATPPAKDLGFC